MEQGISVVVPTKGRIDYVKDMLLSVAIATEHSPEPVQIIIVDDSSEKEAKLIKALCENHGIDYFYRRGGASDTRNFGISQAKFPIVFFVDSDCEVDTHIFEEHLKCYRNENIGGCLGVTEFVGEKTMASNVTEMMPFLRPFQFANNMEYALWGPCTNISFRRDVLNKVKGFASFLPPKEGGEDVDLGYRIQQQGYKIKCNSNAVVYHPREALRGWSGLFERAFRWGRAEAHLLSRHREKSFFDIPKSALLFSILLIACLFKSFTTHTFILILMPFLWILIMAFVQSFSTFYRETTKGSWKGFIYSFISIMVDFVFELGTIVECLYRKRLKLLLFTFIYEERQLDDRWHQGKIKAWSFVISFLILYVMYTILLT
jgi:cellulose synthase/poly-beta-1,6-N-acetylglucosamine synthase-like glycosyltransferase